jgi:ZIP family zinc transporter
MLNAFMWGLVANSSVVLGGLIGSWFTLGKRTIGVIMAFGAGTLLSAVAYELTYESVTLATWSGIPGLGFLVGAFTFFFADRIIGRIGGGNRKSVEASHSSTLVVPLVLAIILDGVPESSVIGLGILERGTVSMAMLVAVFTSGLPEAIAGTAGMRSGGWSRTKILLLWGGIALVTAGSSAAGYGLLGGASPFTLAFIQAFAGGAILMMLANTMFPEAYAHGGKLTGIFMVVGFMLSVGIVLLERT